MRRALPPWATILGCQTVVAAILVVSVALSASAAASEAAAWDALRRGAIVLFRHAHAPGTGDPAGMRIGDCATQRNLDASGRAQAKRIGQALRKSGVAVGRVLSSEWCRARETAELALPGRVETEPAFNSFFSDPKNRTAATAAARRLLLDWRGPGALVVTTHQVNISALVGRSTASGEGIVVEPRGEALAVVGSIRP
jgi:phosphohistidine phosphatase SixA